MSAALLRAAPLLCLALACARCRGEPTTAAGQGADRFLWTAALPAPSAGVPAVAGSLLVVGTGSGLVALSRGDGAVRWQARLRGAVGERVLARDGRVFAAAAAVRAWDAATGRALWTTELPQGAGADYAEPAADGEALYVGTRDRRVLALSPADGHVLWQAAVGAAEWIGGGITGIALSGDTVYAAAARDLTANRYRLTVVLVALDRRTGRELWRYQSAEQRTAPYAAPVLAGDLLVTGGAAEGPMLAVDRATGREAWRSQLWGYMWGKPVVENGRMFVVTQAARAYAVDPATGRVEWERELGAGARYAARCGSALVVPDYHIDLLSPETGRPLRRMLTGGNEEFAAGGVVVDGGVAFVPAQQKVYAIPCP